MQSAVPASHDPGRAVGRATRAGDETPQRVRSIGIASTTPSRPCRHQLLDPRPQQVVDGRIVAPRRLDTIALAPDPAVVDRVLEDVVDGSVVHLVGASKLVDRHVACGIVDEEPSSSLNRVRIHLERPRSLARPPESERRKPSRIRQPPVLGGIALADPLPKPPAVRLGLDRLARPSLPLVLVGRQDALVAEQDRGACCMEIVAGIDGRPQVAREAGDVTDEQDVIVAPGAGDHLLELGGGPDRPARVGDLPLDGGVHEVPAAERAVLLLPLRLRAVVVVLPSRRLPDPARGSKPSKVFEGSRQPWDRCVRHLDRSSGSGLGL